MLQIAERQELETSYLNIQDTYLKKVYGLYQKYSWDVFIHACINLFNKYLFSLYYVMLFPSPRENTLMQATSLTSYAAPDKAHRQLKLSWTKRSEPQRTTWAYQQN